MKYVSLKQIIKDNALLYCIAMELKRKYGFSIKYNFSSHHNEIDFVYSFKALSYGWKCYIQELAIDFASIFMEKAVAYKFYENDSDSETANIYIQEYKQYPGAKKPYYAELCFPDNHRITLLHVHYYQSSITKTAEAYNNTDSMFEDNDTIYYDVKNNRTICYPLNLNGYKKDENFWGKYDEKNRFYVEECSCIDGIYHLQRQKRFSQYYNMFHPKG